MNVGSVCTPDIFTVCAHESLAEAARLLCDKSAEAVVVIASPAVRPTAIGIITGQDILRALLLRQCELSHLKVIDVLSRNPLVLNEAEDVGSGLLKLRAHGARFAPVVGSGGTLRGAVSQRSLSTFADPGQRPADPAAALI